MLHLASLDVAHALRAIRVPVPALVLSVLTVAGCDCPPGPTTIYPVERDRYDELLARYGADGVPRDICGEICRSEPEDGGGGTGGGGTGGAGGTGGGDVGDPNLETEFSCTLVTIEVEKGAAQCTQSIDCGAGRPSHRVGAARGAAHVFAETARLEAASVVSFLDLARELRAHGAPPTLVTWARRCAMEEVGHARVFASLARRHGKPIEPLRTSAFHVRTLEDVAIDNARGGLATELVGAVRLRAQAASAARPALRRALGAIASDEIGHAAFSFELDRWMRSKLARASRARVGEARREQMDLVRRTYADEAPRSHRTQLGVPSAELAQDLVRSAERVAEQFGA